MTRIRNLAMGGLVGGLLTFGLIGVAPAASASAATLPTAPATTAPATTAPATTAPATTPGVTATSTPSSTPSSNPARVYVLTGRQIWRIVHPTHPVTCANAAKELERVHRAVAAASTRMSHFQTMGTFNQLRQTTRAAARTKHDSSQVRGFQKLESTGQALIRWIEGKCPKAAAAA